MTQALRLLVLEPAPVPVLPIPVLPMPVLPIPVLPMPDQDFARAFADPAATPPKVSRRKLWLRAVTVLSPLAVTALLGWVSLGWFGLDGRLTATETALVGVTVFAFYWVVLSVVLALLGLFWRPTPVVGSGQSLNVAILLPMYGEPPRPTMGHTVGLLAELAKSGQLHRYSLYILSDTRQDHAAALELAVWRGLKADYPTLAIHYRRRPQNTDFKSGNIREWVRTHGHTHDAMLVLDADSIMGADSVGLMADALAADASCGLIQTVPRVLPGETIWQQMQSFASEVYGRNLGRGFATWTGSEANFLGHNALIRVRAFATAAGLPHLPGRSPRGGVILSHDFVEAALLRRAGWGVRMLPEASESYEDTPETLIGYVRRDTRWCQGNMQHLRLLTMPGLHPVSRFHLLQGAMAYLASVWWLCLLILWAIPDQMGDGPDIWGTNPLMPVWPDLPVLTQSTIAGLVGLMLIGPKLIGAVAYVRENRVKGRQLARFAGSVVAEMALSMLLAPTLMVQQVQAVLRTLAGFNGGWTPHLTGRPTVPVLIRFHATETLLGFGLLGLAGLGGLTVWLLPIAICLGLSVPLSLLAQSQPKTFQTGRKQETAN